MEGELRPREESLAPELLSEFQRLFGLIDNQAEADLTATAEKIKRLIFEQLKLNGRINNEITYETWLQETFPSSEPPRETLLIELAEDYQILNPDNKSDILRQKLVQILNDYKHRTRFNPSQSLIAEAEALIKQDYISVAEYENLVSRLISLVYNG